MFLYPSLSLSLTSRFSLHLIEHSFRYGHQHFDVVILDDAEQCSELHSIMASNFNPKAFILFGDRSANSIFEKRFDQQYPQHNFSQTLFHRLVNNENENFVHELKINHRFSRDLLTFFNKICNLSMLHHASEMENIGFSLSHFYLLHSTDETLILTQISRLLYCARQFKIAVIKPPNTR